MIDRSKYICATIILFFLSLCIAEDKTENLSQNIDIQLTSHLGDNQIFIAGDTVFYYLSLNHDASHQLIQILPSKLLPNAFFRQGDFYRTPDDGTPFRFEVSEPFGKETIWVFASIKTLPILPGRELDNGLKILSDTIHSIIEKIHQYKNQENILFGQISTSITTKQNIPRNR